MKTKDGDHTSLLMEELEHWQKLYSVQPGLIQNFLDTQAGVLADAMVEKKHEVHFSFPDKLVILNGTETSSVLVPENERIQDVGGFWSRIQGIEVRHELIAKLVELEQSPDTAIASSAGLLRFTAARHMVSNMLPDGRPVAYQPESDNSIPNVPIDSALQSAITQASDAIVEDGDQGDGRGDLQVPFVPAARKFFLPQWVAFDEKGHLLASSMTEAEAHLKSMQKYIQIIHRASALAPYFVISDEYQRKRYGILGQLVNQGRLLAHYKTVSIIRDIKKRAERQELNRGLSISLPYFNDQNLEISLLDFQVIPTGRIMFVSAFVVRASHEEQAKINQDTRLSPSTRKHIIEQLELLESAFQNSH